MPVVSEIVRVSKSNLHYAIAYRMRAKFNCCIIAFQGHQTCMYRSPDPSDFFPEGLARETSLDSELPTYIIYLA